MSIAASRRVGSTRAALRAGAWGVLMLGGAAACGKERPFAEGAAAAPGEAGATASAPGTEGLPPALCDGPTCTSIPEQVEPVGGLAGAAGDDLGAAIGSDAGVACVEGATESCGPSAQEGLCRFGTRTCAGGSWGECVGAIYPAARDCSSPEDNDCDGQPDDALDDVCRCPAGGTQPCDEHPGFDGRGACRAGVQSCVLAPDAATSDWGECADAVPPQAADSCETPGDDADCDGTPNGGCSCVEGVTIECGPETDEGVCVRGTSTCEGGAFTPCQGAVFPSRRDCSSELDNDCDGVPDNTLDATCACVVGATRACGAHPGLDGNGPCRAGRQTCEAGDQNATSAFGACVGSVGPALRDSCAVLGDDADCSGSPNTGCQCVAGQGNGPCSADPSNSRCNQQGQCAPCQLNTDCALVSGGRNLCVSGVCTAPRCGDGIVQPERGETCDDGETVAGDECSPDCQIVHAPVGASAFGGGHVCMLQPSGEIICWGTNGSGELGNGSTAAGIQGATRVFAIADAIQVGVGPGNTCAVRRSGALACWGVGFLPTPTNIPGVGGARQVAIASTQVCALLGGRVSCAGREPGSPVGEFIDMGINTVDQISAGNGQVCALRTDGTLLCWGSNNAGQLGIGEPGNPVDVPQLTLASGIVEVAAGGETTCVRLASGGSQCFGSGPLGSRAAPAFSATPQDVVSLPDPIQMVAASGSRCALLSDQTVRCWGSQPFGDADGAPVPIALPGAAVAIGAGSDVMCAVMEDLSVYCWGGNLTILGLTVDPGGPSVPVELPIP